MVFVLVAFIVFLVRARCPPDLPCRRVHRCASRAACTLQGYEDFDVMSGDGGVRRI